MYELSVADGFVEINENVGEMIKYVANEPSVGLYYIQQHVQNAVPNVIRLKNTVTEKSHEVCLHTEDLEDSIAMTRSMKECGPPIINDMIRDIKASLTVMSTRQPVRGVIQQRNSSYQIRGSSSWAPVTWTRRAVSAQNDIDHGGSYLSNMLKSAKEKAGNLKWPQLDPQPLDPENDSITQPDEAEELLPVSSQVEDLMTDDKSLVTDGKLQPANGYEEFKADREAKLEEWLKGSGNNQSRTGVVEGEGHHQLDNL